MTQSVGREPMSFSVGDEVVCVNAERASGTPPECWDALLRRGEHYVIRWVGAYSIARPRGKYLGVRLRGIDRSDVFWLDTPYAADRFRPVKREAIQLFKDMCVSQSPLVPVGTDGVKLVREDLKRFSRFLGGKD